MEVLYEKPYEEIIQNNTDQYEQEIAEKLYSSMKVWIRKHDMPHQHKPSWKTYKKWDNKGCDMWLKGNEPKIKYFFMQYKIVSQKKNKDIKRRIEASTSRVTKCL